MTKRFSQKLQDLQAQQRYRSMSLPNGIDLTSNDSLGMRTHPKLREAALTAIENSIDLGAGGARLLRGHTQHHEALEHFAAEHFGAEAALYFATGYQANLALFATLPSRHDVVVFDELLHASSRDGLQMSNAKTIKVAHNDLQGFEDALKRAREKADQIWLAVESIYSMDGDRAPLEKLLNLSRAYDAILIIDEAHATGIYGPTGKGLSENMDRENVITLHTCGKAIGVAGGLICASKTIIDTLINTARSFIYSTAPPPLQALLTLESLRILSQEQERREQLFQHIEFCKTLPFVSKINSHIVPIIFGDDACAVEAAHALQERGYDIRAIRPPTVPEGTARLRLSLSINLTEEILIDFSNCISELRERKAA